jgi:opacity protein-like surface antigen
MASPVDADPSYFYSTAGYDYVSGGLEGGDIGIGYRFNRFYGIELGYTYAGATATDDFGDSASIYAEEVTIDVMGYLPLGRRSPVSLFSTIGVGYTYGTAEVDTYFGSAWASAWGPEFRVGAGIEYRVTDNIGIRTMVRYQYSDFGGIGDSRAIVTTGVTYRF